MYEHVRGTLARKHPAEAVIDVGGVGYRLVIPLSTYERLPVEGAVVTLFASLHVREDAHRLYGFATRDERAFFHVLQTVSGVGPSVALGIVSSLTFSAFRAAVLTGDAAQLRRVRGIGKRLSERLVVELKDAVGEMATADDAAPTDSALRDALLALQALGFPVPAAEHALREVRNTAPELRDPGEIVRRALKLL